MDEIRVAQTNKRAVYSIQDVVSGGSLIRDLTAPAVMVTAESDLDDLPAYPAGTLAYTAGFGSMWQLSAAGEWVEV